MVTVRWLRLQVRPLARRGVAHSVGGRGDLDAWLDAIHRLAQRRVAERERLAHRGAETRARLSRPE